MISMLYFTYRPGGFDVLAQSFAPDTPDYELVVVDDHPGRVGRGEALRFLKGRGINVGWYGGSKPKCYPDIKGGLCNAMNTGLSHCRGDYVVVMTDYCFADPLWPLQWRYEYGRQVKLLGTERVLLSGGAIVYGADKPADPDDVKSWPTPLQLRPKWPWVAGEFETFYCGAPLAFYLATNGVDERADHCHCWQVRSTVAQAKLLDCKLVVNGTICCHMIDHRVWDTPGERSDIGGEGLWRNTHKNYTDTEPTWQVRSPNPGFDLLAERTRNGL